MTLEVVSNDNIEDLTLMMLELWSDSTFDNELKNCQRILKSKNETVYLAREKDELTAFVYLSLRREYVEGAKNYPVAYIEGIYVKDGSRKKGLGKQLIEKAIVWAQSKGCTQLASDAEILNSSSISFHQHVGFKEVNRIANFILDL